MANSNSDNVSVVSLTSNTTIEEIPVGSNPLGIALDITQNGDFVYIANSGGGSGETVSVIDTRINQVIATITVGNTPVGVAVTPDGTRAYVGVNGDNSIVVIDVASQSVVQSIDTVALSPTTLFILPDGKSAYIAYTTPEVTVLDLETNELEAPFSVPVRPAFFTSTRKGDELFYSSVESPEVVVLETATNTVIDRITVGQNPFGISITPGGEFVYVANSGGFSGTTVSVIEVETNTIIETITVGEGPFGLATSPQELELKVATGRDRFLTQSEYFNRITWSPPMTKPTSYGVYLDERREQLIATLPGNATEYKDHNQRKGEVVTYYVAAYKGSILQARGSISVETE